MTSKILAVAMGNNFPATRSAVTLRNAFKLAEVGRSFGDSVLA
jgi:hypothetical protein